MHILIALNQFLVQLHADGRRSHTRDQYERHIKLLATWLAGEQHGGEVGEIDHQTIARFLVAPCVQVRSDGTPKKATSVNTLRSSLRGFFGHLHDAGETRVNPARLIRLAKTAPPPPRSLSDAEEGRLVETLGRAVTWAERRDRVLFRLMMATGIRLSSALGLRVEDLDLEAGEAWLRSTKGDRPDRVFVPDEAVELLKEWMAPIDSGHLFAGRTGEHLCARQAHRRFRELLMKARVKSPASPHWLRHGFAMRVYRQTGDLLVVKEALLHRSIASSLAYTRCSPARLRAAVQGP